MFKFSFLLHNGYYIVHNNELSNPILSSSICDINSRFALPCLALREQSYFKGVFAEASQPNGSEFKSIDSDQ